LPRFAGRGGGPLGGGEDLARVPEESGALGGERHVAGIPVEQGDTEFPLQAADLLTNSGLDDVQKLGGAAEVPRFRDGEEVMHLPEFHGCGPSGKINNGS